MTLIRIMFVVFAIVSNTLFIICCCKVAAKADEQSECDYERLMEYISQHGKPV